MTVVVVVVVVVVVAMVVSKGSVSNVLVVTVKNKHYNLFSIQCKDYDNVRSSFRCLMKCRMKIQKNS